MKKKKFDGIANFNQDNLIENKLEKHFKRHSISSLEVLKNFPIFSRRVTMKKFLAHYELFQKVVNLPGDIVELGVYKGLSLMSWANFLEIRSMGDRHKKVIGFDNFKGFTKFHSKDGKSNRKVNKVIGGFKSKNFEIPLQEAIKIFDEDRFIPYKKRVHIVKGDAELTVPKYFKDNPGIRISLLHFDVDLYKPTLKTLNYLWPLVVKGGVVVFDEYGIPPWEGESKAVDEFLSKNNIKNTLQRFEWSSNPGAYLIK